ncbi:MAG TPA: response regulator [Steroidobacter sp.]|nr:response regulator [Steroidobacter sp.]
MTCDCIVVQERFARSRRCHFQEMPLQIETKMLILVVEDEPICALSTVAELEQAGHETLGPAATLEEGLELARNGHPTLALIDIDLMHAGDGLELAKRLRELHIAAVFVSAQHPAAFENQDLALGYIGKPYNPSDLPPSIEVISAILEGKSPPEASLPRALQLFH